MLRFILILLLVTAGCAFGAAAGCDPAGRSSTTQIEFFEARIRPVLAERCYSCHNSAKSAQGGLALDSRSSLLKGGANGPIVVRGNPEQSRLIAILQHKIAGLEMPRGAPKLPESVIADVRRWIAMGLPDPRDNPPFSAAPAAASSPAQLKARKQWWSFQPIRNAAAPELPPDRSGRRWSDHPIDRFIYSRLAKNTLAPSAIAAPTARIRRLYFALAGLPPSPTDVLYWTEQLKHNGGFEALVDHLLALPQFGETWARHWMDWIRYADSHGSEGDPEIVNGWRYRDYLIRALNADVPYDQLIREHMAGDLLPHPRVNQALGINESAIGTAHWRMVFHGYAPTDALEEKVRFTDDQINTFSKAFLGLTVACARCHDHKFDAIGQRDYYALFGILASCRPGRIAIDLPARLNKNKAELTTVKQQIRGALADAWLNSEAPLRQKLLDPGSASNQTVDPKSLIFPLLALRRAEKANAPTAEVWKHLVAEWAQDRKNREANTGRSYKQCWNLSNGSDYAGWFRSGNGLPEKPGAAGDFPVALNGDAAIAGIYPSGIVTNSLSSKHAARLSSGYVRLDGDYELWVRALGDGGASLRYVVQNYPRDGAVFPVIKLAPKWQWHKFDLSYWTGDEIHIELADGKDAPVLVTDQDRSWFGIREAVVLKKGEPGPPVDTREMFDPLFESSAPAPASSNALAENYVHAILAAVRAWREGSLSDSQALLLDACVAEGLLPNRLGALAAVKPLVERYRSLEAEIEVPTRVPGLDEAAARNQPLYLRGSHKTPGAEVPRGFLEAINPIPYHTNQSGRLELAEDLVRKDNPLTRRVIVNRLWHHLFGRGIVVTPDNFGKLGEPPTHPELLDYLATRFQERGWSIKDMIRFIVTSKTWQLSAQPSPQARRVDPENRLLSHANTRRVDAEAIRDSLLAVTGTLAGQEYGAPVDGASPRRSVYVRVQRTALDPFLRAFDFPEPFSATGRRDVTNVPAQSLTMMNDTHVASLAASWASALLANKSLRRDEDRIQQMFMTALCRNAAPEEVTRILLYIKQSRLEQNRAAARSAEIGHQIEEHVRALQTLTAPVRERLRSETAQAPAANKSFVPQPINRWDFAKGLEDLSGSSNGVVQGAAALQDGVLTVHNQGYVITSPLKQSVKAKTLEAWVQLDGLDQSGGGVMSIISPDENTFDAIVFGEREPQKWMAGSDNFMRTQSLNGPLETDAARRPVHIAITYGADGTIAAYRNGVLYGSPYKSAGPLEFKAGRAVIGFGIRHLPAGGNKMLSGRILRAQLYDRALSAGEIAASYRNAPFYVPESQVLAALSPVDRDSVRAHESRITALEAELKSYGPVLRPGTSSDADIAIWSDVARAIFNFKEFIYLN